MKSIEDEFDSKKQTYKWVNEDLKTLDKYALQVNHVTIAQKKQLVFFSKNKAKMYWKTRPSP